jgi:hypothetical protein
MDREELLREAAEEQLLQESDRRRFLYADVETLICDGVLTQRVDLFGCEIVLCTITIDQHAHLLTRCESDEANWKRHRIAHALHMVQGYHLDPTNPNTAYHVYREWLQGVRGEIVEVLDCYVTGLGNRLGRACRMTNAYCYEKYSRALWKRRPRSTARTATNPVQELWWAFNEAEDAFESDLRRWQHTRSIAGSMSGKAAKSLKKSEDQWKKRRADLSVKVITDAVNWVISGERDEQKPLTVTVNGQTLVVPKVHASQTVDEMQDELMRAVRGEKDYHDHMVDQYKAHHRAKNEAARRERQEALDKARKASDERGISGHTTIVGYTPEQLAEINPEILNQPVARRQQGAPERERFDQYLDTSVGVGWIGADGRPEKAGASLTKDPNPEKDESLQDKISRRRPRLKS